MASELRRRDVLRVSGTLALAGAAGCLDDVIGETSEGNDSDGEGGDGDDPTPADGNEAETAEGTDGPDDERGSNGTDGPDEANNSEVTDEVEGSTGTDDSVDDGENDSEDGDDETGEPNETEDSDGEDGEGEGAGVEETEANDSGGDEANDSAEDDGTGEGGESGEGNREGDDGDADGADGENQSTDPPEGFVAYTNDELGYSIAHPEGWEVEESGEEVYVGDPESRRELGVLTLDAAAFDSSEALAAEFLANLEADYEGVEVREEADRSLASGQDARLLDVVYGDSEGERGRRRSRLLFVTDAETDAGYVAEVAAPAEAFDDALAERAETMLGSFRIERGESLERIGGPRVTRPLDRVALGS